MGRMKFTQQEMEQFAKVWNTAATIEHVAAVFKIEKRDAITRARHMRQKGAKLKFFRAGAPVLDWDAIRAASVKALKHSPASAGPADPRYAKVMARQSFFIDYIRCHQMAKSSHEVMKRFKLTASRREIIASNLRRNGVPLKDFRRNLSYNWPMLIQAAKQSLEDLAAGRVVFRGTRHKKEPRLK